MFTRSLLQQSTKKMIGRQMSTFSNKNPWFRDQSVYPLIAIMGSAGALVSGFTAYKIAVCPDVQFNKNVRQSETRSL